MIRDEAHFVEGGAKTAATYQPGDSTDPTNYPTLNTTTDQADLGLTETTAIANVTDLQNMNNDKAGNYYLTGDIDASATSGWNGGAGFVPIDNFTGTFDGKGYTISDLTIDRNSNDQGLFGLLEVPARVANVTLSNVSISGGIYFCGALAGRAECDDTGDIIIQNCHATGTIAPSGGGGMGYYGGLIGQADITGGDTLGMNYIYDCSSTCTLDMSTATLYPYRGGFIGFAQYCTISNCTATGSLTGGDGGDTEMGGFVGRVSNDCTITYCSATGDVTGLAQRGGGFAGYIVQDSVISKCSATGDVSGNLGVGGFVGESGNTNSYTDCYAWGNATATVANIAGGFVGAATDTRDSFTNCYSIGAATVATTDVGGFAGDMHVSMPVTDCFWDSEASGNATTDENKGDGHNTTWMKTRSNFENAGWDISENTDTIWYMTETAATEESWTITSMSNLIGETVGVLIDGVVYPDRVVADDGTIDTSDWPSTATHIHIGLKYTSELQPLKPTLNMRTGTSITQIAAIHKMGALFKDSDGMKYGTSTGDLYEINIDDIELKNKSSKTGLFSGIIDISVDGGYTIYSNVRIYSNNLLPCTVTGLIPDLTVTGI